MGNKGAGGPFAPLVVVVRGVVGEKEFNKLRGKAISLHSQGGCLYSLQDCSPATTAAAMLWAKALRAAAWCSGDMLGAGQRR